MSTPAQHHAVRTVLQLFIASHPRRLLLGALMASCTALMGCVLLGISGWFITATYIAGLSAGTAIAFDVFVPSASIRLLAIGRTASRYGERLVTHDATFSVLVTLREKLFTGWSTPEALQQLQLRPARILFRLTRDIDALQAMYLRILVPATAAIVSTLVASIILAFTSIWLGLATFTLLTGTGLAIGIMIARQSALASARTIQATERLRHCAVDLVAGQTDLLMSGQLPHWQAKLAAADARLTRADQAVNRTDVLGGWSFGVFQSVTLGCALLVATFLMQHGLVTAAGAALVILLIWSVSETFAAVRLGALEVGKTWVAARRLAPHLHTAAQAGTATAPDNSDALQMDAVTYRYIQDAATPVLDHITLSVAHGERVAIVGSSGSGKSTLLSLATGELSVHTGCISSSALCWLPQRTQLFQDSVRSNLDLAQAGIDDAQLWQALDMAGLGQDIRATRDGLDTRLGEGGIGLSGGQSRRLALARLFLAQPGFWVLDEPTEGLDQGTAADVLQSLQQGIAGRTLLLATHLQREAALADRLLVLQQGRIVQDVQRGTAEFDQVLASLRPG